MSTCLLFLVVFFFSLCWHNWVGVNLHLFCQSVHVSVSPVAFDRRWSSKLFWSWLAFGGITFITSLWGVSGRVVFMVQRCEHMEISPETCTCWCFAAWVCVCTCAQACHSLCVCVCRCVCMLFACMYIKLLEHADRLCLNIFAQTSSSINQFDNSSAVAQFFVPAWGD